MQLTMMIIIVPGGSESCFDQDLPSQMLEVDQNLKSKTKQNQ